MPVDPTLDRDKLQNKLDSITKKIVKNYKPEKIILFGSVAREEAKKDSDIDLFIIKKTNEKRRHRAFQVGKLFLPRDFALDVIVYTPKEVKDSYENNFFIREIINHGKTIYQKV